MKEITYGAVDSEKEGDRRYSMGDHIRHQGDQPFCCVWSGGANIGGDQLLCDSCHPEVGI